MPVINASVAETSVNIHVIEEISSLQEAIEPILYEPTLWETITTFIQNVINLI